MPNRLGMRNVRAIPNDVPNDGGTVSIQFEARTSLEDATANVRYTVASGFPFRVTAGGSASPQVTTTERTVAQDVTISRTQPDVVSFVQMEITASVPGDVSQRHTCFVWIDGTVGEAVRAFRQANGLTQGALATRLGVSSSVISRIEGGRFPSPELEQAIAEEMG
jgi:DNA-binding XRE family transcriptional regulator